MLPPKRLWIPAPIVPTMLRERTDDPAHDAEAPRDPVARQLRRGRDEGPVQHRRIRNRGAARSPEAYPACSVRSSGSKRRSGDSSSAGSPAPCGAAAGRRGRGWRGRRRPTMTQPEPRPDRKGEEADVRRTRTRNCGPRSGSGAGGNPRPRSSRRASPSAGSSRSWALPPVRKTWTPDPGRHQGLDGEQVEDEAGDLDQASGRSPGSPAGFTVISFAPFSRPKGKKRSGRPAAPASLHTLKFPAAKLCAPLTSSMIPGSPLHIFITRAVRAKRHASFGSEPRPVMLRVAHAEPVVGIAHSGARLLAPTAPTSAPRGATSRRGSRAGRADPSRGTTRGRWCPCRRGRSHSASPVRRSHGPASGPSGISPSGIASPHAVRGATSPPHAACSHSASVGSRQRPPAVSESHAQNAMASSQLTPTTGLPSARNAASLHQGGGAPRPESRYAAYSRLVTGTRPSAYGRPAPGRGSPRGRRVAAGRHRVASRPPSAPAAPRRRGPR